MESRFLLVASLLLLPCIVISAEWQLKFEASYENKNTTCYDHYNYYHNACDPNNATTPMSQVSVANFLACPARCQLRKGCMAFFFAPEGGRKGVCLTYNVTSRPVDMSCNGSVYGQLEMASCRPGWSSSCVSDVECTGDDRVCLEGSCTCEVGLMFEPSSGNCVAECEEYNNKFSVATSTHFETPDNITLTGPKNKNACAAECLKTDCRSFQYKPSDSICVLSNFTVATAAPNSTRHETNNALYQRECVVKL